MRRLRQAFVASCAVIAIAAVLVWLRNGLTSHLLECSWAEPFDAPGGSGYRQHCLQLIIGRRVTLAHSTDWCGAAQPVRFTGSADALVNPHLRGRRAPSNARRAPRVVPYPDGETGASIHPGSRPIVVYPEADGGTTVVIPGRRPVVVYPPIP